MKNWQTGEWLHDILLPSFEQYWASAQGMAKENKNIYWRKTYEKTECFNNRLQRLINSLIVLIPYLRGVCVCVDVTDRSLMEVKTGNRKNKGTLTWIFPESVIAACSPEGMSRVRLYHWRRPTESLHSKGYTARENTVLWLGCFISGMPGNSCSLHKNK